MLLGVSAQVPGETPGGGAIGGLLVAGGVDVEATGEDSGGVAS